MWAGASKSYSIYFRHRKTRRKLKQSNWKSSSLFCLLFPLASCCRTLPLDKGKKKYVCNGDLTRSISFLHLTSYNNILLISRPMVLPKAVVSKICEGYVRWVLRLGNACVRGDPYEPPKIDFFERFYMIKSNWKSYSLFCLLFPLASCCRTLPLYNNILCSSRPMALPNAVVSQICEGYVHWVLQLGNACVRGTLTNPKNWFFRKVLHNKK